MLVVYGGDEGFEGAAVDVVEDGVGIVGMTDEEKAVAS